jgi:WD40 repeat protein
VLDLHWSRDSKVLFSASADMHLASWDVETGERIRRHPGHEEVVNCMDVSKRGEEMLVSGSDDGYIGVSVSACHFGAFLTLTDLGHENERRRNIHPHRLPHNRHMLGRSWQRAVHRRHRQ